MPEGHTVHRLARDHNRWFAGQKMMVLSPQGRFEHEAEQLSGRRLLLAEAYGKHLIYQFSGSLLVHVHLGLYGKFRVHRNPPPEPRGAVRVRMIGDQKGFDLNGPNCCELLSKAELEGLKARLGPDPLRSDADPEVAWQKIHRSRSAIGALLLNQSVMAGVGNIYRAEILHMLAIHPNRPGNQISRIEFDQIWELAIQLMTVGVRYNRIITVERTLEGKTLSRLNATERLQIYKKPECPRCAAEVYCWEVGNRMIYACENCQL